MSVGALCTILDTFIFTSLVYIFGNNIENIIILNIISFSIVVSISFFLNGKFTFRDEYLSQKKFIKYYGSSSLGMILNTTIVAYLMTVIGLGTIVSKIITACIVVFFNYFMSKRFIFKIPLNSIK